MQYWRLPGPDEHLLDKQQVAAYLGVSERGLDRLIADGRFPQGVRTGPGRRSAVFWLGTDVAAYLHLRGRCAGGLVEDDGGEETVEE